MKKIIVVGAGILGASTAYQLAKMGAEVLVIDRKDKGQATHAAKGIICPWLSPRQNQAWYRMAKAGAHFYPSFIEELRKAGEKETGYAPVGALSIHHEKEKIEKIENGCRNVNKVPRKSVRFPFFLKCKLLACFRCWLNGTIPFI